jgi:hypothetical protein
MNEEELKLLGLEKQVEGVLDTKEKVLQFEEEMAEDAKKYRRLVWCCNCFSDKITLRPEAVSMYRRRPVEVKYYCPDCGWWSPKREVPDDLKEALAKAQALQDRIQDEFKKRRVV